MGRRRLDHETFKFSILLPKSTEEVLTGLAAREKKNISEMVRTLIDEGIERRRGMFARQETPLISLRLDEQTDALVRSWAQETGYPVDIFVQRVIHQNLVTIAQQVKADREQIRKLLKENTER